MVKLATKHSTPISTVLGTYKDAINAALVTYLDSMPYALGYRANELSPQIQDALAKLREYTLRPGKRIRGVLAAAAYDDAMSTQLAPSGIALGVAQEIMQSYILIIDDVTDRSPLRRGKPTVHEEYKMQLDKFGDEHEANMLAAYVSLIADHIAQIALLQSTEKPEHIVSALRRLHTNFTLTGFGQIDDVWHKVGRAVSSEDIIHMYALKTGYYTFVNPLQTGLALAGALPRSAAISLEQFGRDAGVAFQIHDDYLGVFGEGQMTGKGNLDDLQEGKFTLLVSFALEHGSLTDVSKLKQIVQCGAPTEDDLREAQEIFTRSGATLYVQTETNTYARAAKAQLAKISVLSDTFKRFLIDLIEYSVTRTS